jgi:hypothetical protein
MAYGSEGSQYPDYEYGPPAEQERRRSRPEPYDPFQTRAREQPAQQQYQPRDGRPRDPYTQEQHVRAALDTASYDTAAYRDRDQDREYDGRPRHAQPGHPRDAHGRDASSQTQRLPRPGATRMIDGDEFPPAVRERGPGERDRDWNRDRDRDGRRPDDAFDRAADGLDRPGGRSNRRKGKKVVPPHVRRRRKIIRRSILAVFLVVSGYVGVTMYPYLTAPGTDTLSARVAEWGRDHHLSWAVTWLENATYKAPPTGGSLNAGQLAQLQGGQATAPAKMKADLPVNIVPLAAGTVRGEGVWHPVTMDASGVPIVEKAALRPDAQHTSDLAYAVWMNQKALTFTLHPGYQQPGGSWKTPDSITAGQRPGLVATWNGGFKIKPDDALGGFYAEGRTAAKLVAGKAAEVFYRDGSIQIGQWGRDQTMTPQVVGVRQNLSLLVDRGQVAVGPGDGSSAQWGYTIKNSYFIARSGVGMTSTGDIVYVSGRYLSVYTLAKLLQAAGAVNAMELDINPDWVSFMSYGGANPANPTPAKLWDFTQPADRYFQPSDRDFVTVYKR